MFSHSKIWYNVYVQDTIYVQKEGNSWLRILDKGFGAELSIIVVKLTHRTEMLSNVIQLLVDSLTRKQAEEILKESATKSKYNSTTEPPVVTGAAFSFNSCYHITTEIWRF